MKLKLIGLSQILSNIYLDIVQWDQPNCIELKQYHWEIASHKNSMVKIPSDQEKKNLKLIFLKWKMMKSLRVTC